MPTSLTLSPAANGYRRHLYSGRAVSVYYDRHPTNWWIEHTRDQDQLSVILNRSDCLLSWKRQDRTDACAHQIEDPTVWLVPAGTPHALACAEETEMVTLFIDREFTHAIAGCQPPEVMVVALARLAARDDVIGNVAKAFVGLCRGESAANPIYVESIGTVLGTHLLQAMLLNRGISGHKVGLPDDSLRRVTRYIEEHLGEELHLSVLGKAAGFSPGHFGRLFKTSFGMPPHHFVMRRRVAKAAELLRTTPMKEIEIALLCGFSDDTLMARWFRRVLNIRPSEARVK